MGGSLANVDVCEHWTQRIAFRSPLPAARFFTLLTAALFGCCFAGAQEPIAKPIEIKGNAVTQWQIGDADASLIEGDCFVTVGQQIARADAVLVVVDGEIGRIRTRMVVEGLKVGDSKASQPSTFTYTNLTVPKIAAPLMRPLPTRPPKLLDFLPDDDSTIDTPESLVRTVQFAAPAGELPAPLPVNPGLGGQSFSTGTHSINIDSRDASVPLQFDQSIDRPEIGETVIVARGGVTVLIRDVRAQLPDGSITELGTVTLSANRIVGWLPLLSGLFNGTTDMSQSEGELYLEGDIVFRQGERIIYAESMYYNVNAERGMVLDAEAITTIPEYAGIVRLKAEVLQQVARGNFIAFDAAVTSSRMGVPQYWLQSERLQLTDRERIITDPVTGYTAVDREPFVESNDNFVYFGGVPVLYWPRLATSLERPTCYLAGLKIKNDDIFGSQLFLDWDLFQLFGIQDAPRGVDWTLSTDYLSRRGPAIGTTLRYTVPGLWGLPGPVTGFFDTWLIHDTGLDNLGRDRRNLVPETTTRGRSLLRHRHYLANDWEFIGEIGWISDRNFLEQYLENEWDREVDHRTAVRLRKYYGNQLFDLSAEAWVNRFFTNTARLPKFDHYMFGTSLGEHVTWSAHNNVSYSQLGVGSLPTDPAEAAEYSPVPGEVPAEGIIALTRQELTMPVQLGPVRVVPGVSGEASHYGQAANGDPLTRLIGQAGIRASLPMVSVDPSVSSSLLNVRGIAHKVEWTAEYFYADSNTNLEELPLYDPLDDNAQEQFRRRFIQDTFGGVLPLRFDPRNYAFRQGIQSNVASPSDVIADNLQQFRFGLHQRWQTKRGLPGRERIVDLLELDLDVFAFPKASRDNFGEVLGPTTYDVRYNIGDRVTFLSDGYFDFFSDGLRSISAGVRTSRPGRGDIYVGLLSLEGPISSTVLRSAYDYRLNEKWIATAGNTYDFGPTGNVGQSLALTRIGESMLLRLGVNVDAGRNNVGVAFAIEPRFWPRPKLGLIGGQLIPPPGVEGLE